MVAKLEESVGPEGGRPEGCLSSRQTQCARPPFGDAPRRGVSLDRAKLGC